jgi:hypothetical protein
MPPHADQIQRLREATCAIVNALAAVRSITGRNDTSNCVTWSTLEESVLPVIVYRIGSFTQTGEDRDAREGSVRFTAVAAGNDADRTVHELLDAIEDGYTASALAAQSVDGAPLQLTRDDGDEEPDGPDAPRQGTRNVHYAHLTVALTMTL